MLRLKDRRQKQQSAGFSFSSAVEFTTSATEQDKLTSTDDDRLKKTLPRINFNKKLFKGLAATLECDHETASDSGEMDKQNDHRYHHLAIMASSGDETKPATKSQ